MDTAAGRIALWPKVVRGVKAPVISLDGAWKFSMTPGEEPFRNEVDFTGWSDAQVPGELALQGFDIEADKPCGYKRRFTVPDDYRGNAVFLRFEGVQSHARVWVNGEAVGRHGAPATIWDCDITRTVVPGAEAVLTVLIEDREDDPAILSRYARHQTGGILRSVTLLARPTVHLSRLHV